MKKHHILGILWGLLCISWCSGLFGEWQLVWHAMDKLITAAINTSNKTLKSPAIWEVVPSFWMYFSITVLNLAGVLASICMIYGKNFFRWILLLNGLYLAYLTIEQIGVIIRYQYSFSAIYNLHGIVRAIAPFILVPATFWPKKTKELPGS